MGLVLTLVLGKKTSPIYKILWIVTQNKITLDFKKIVYYKLNTKFWNLFLNELYFYVTYEKILVIKMQIICSNRILIVTFEMIVFTSFFLLICIAVKILKYIWISNVNFRYYSVTAFFRLPAHKITPNENSWNKVTQLEKKLCNFVHLED